MIRQVLFDRLWAARKTVWWTNLNFVGKLPSETSLRLPWRPPWKISSKNFFCTKSARIDRLLVSLDKVICLHSLANLLGDHCLRSQRTELSVGIHYVFSNMLYHVSFSLSSSVFFPQSSFQCPPSFFLLPPLDSLYSRSLWLTSSRQFGNWAVSGIKRWWTGSANAFERWIWKIRNWSAKGIFI